MTRRTETYDGSGNLISVTDTRDLATVKLQKWNDINAYREVVLNKGIWFIGYCWGSDERSRANITGAIAGVVAGIPLPSGFTWRDNNNNNVPFTIPMLVGLGGYTIGYVNEVYGASWEMKTVVDGLATLEDVDNFIIPDQAWPDGNMDGSMPINMLTSLANATVGEAYNVDLDVHGGKTPYTLSVTSGALPAGLAVANTAIGGTPTANGVATFDISVTDSTTPNAVVFSQSYTLNVS